MQQSGGADGAQDAPVVAAASGSAADAQSRAVRGPQLPPPTPLTVREIVDTLRGDCPQMILTGPPGCGKTYFVRALSAALTRQPRDPDLVRRAQGSDQDDGEGGPEDYYDYNVSEMAELKYSYKLDTQPPPNKPSRGTKRKRSDAASSSGADASLSPTADKGRVKEYKSMAGDGDGSDVGGETAERPKENVAADKGKKPADVAVDYDGRDGGSDGGGDADEGGEPPARPERPERNVAPTRVDPSAHGRVLDLSLHPEFAYSDFVHGFRPVNDRAKKCGDLPGGGGTGGSAGASAAAPPPGASSSSSSAGAGGIAGGSNHAPPGASSSSSSSSSAGAGGGASSGASHNSSRRRDDGGGGGATRYDLVPGHLLRFLADNEHRRGVKVLILDEMNRGKISAVLGEVFTCLDYRGRPKRLAQSRPGDEPLVLPKNLYILGTMNDRDESVSKLDMALRDRFRVFAYPGVQMHKALESFLKLRGLWGVGKTGAVVSRLKEVNEKTHDKLGGHQVGHARFLRIVGGDGPEAGTKEERAKAFVEAFEARYKRTTWPLLERLMRGRPMRGDLERVLRPKAL
jgi:hypothetical protein